MKQAQIVVIALTITTLANLPFAQAATAIPDTDTPIVNMKDYKPPAVPSGASYYYPKDFRILDCYQCF